MVSPEKDQAGIDKRFYMCYTYLCVFEVIMEKRNLTLALPRPLVSRAKEMAVREDRSLNDYVRAAIEEKIDRSSGYTKARERQLGRLGKGLNLGTRGRKPSSRDDLHDRK